MSGAFLPLSVANPPLFRNNNDMKRAMRLALYQPDMPANTGAMMRLCACLGLGLDIIEPCGFVFDDRRLKRAAMDYVEHLDYRRHASWNEFLGASSQRRIVLLTTKADTPYYRFSFRRDDILLVGRESAGAPDHVHARADARLIVPMQTGLRSLNVSLAAAMVAGEAIRQIEEDHEQNIAGARRSA
jgi:tRNA (cytidine/uridine-2'-O-)-methyltransferase